MRNEIKVLTTKRMSKFFLMCLEKIHMVNPSRSDLSHELLKVEKKADQLIERARRDAEFTRTEAEKAKKEAESIRNYVDRIIEQNNAMW
ncbi:Chaperone protein DnaK [Bienertia sinuspersici]